MSAAYALFAFVALQRIAELFYAAHNTRALLARGGIEIGRRHYPLIVATHIAWLGAIAWALAHTPNPAFHWGFFGLFVALQLLRLWVLVTLGPYWTTRIITVPGAPLVRKGPYRFLRHPNYVVVAGEIAALPLVYGFVGIAIVFSLLDALVLWVRVSAENAGLAARRKTFTSS